MAKENDTNTKGNESKRHKSRLSLCQSGCYAEFYTQNGYFVKVKPALGIDKVLFAFVKKGSGGKGFDIYVDVDKFDLLCDSIINRELMRDLTNSTMNSPAWEYITGKNGAKTIKIFKGDSGIIINGSLKDQKVYAHVPVAYSDLKIMAKWHHRISNSYFERLAQICIDAMEENKKYYKDPDDQEDSEPSEKAAFEGNIAGVSQNTQGKKSAQDQPPKNTAPVERNAAGKDDAKDSPAPPNRDQSSKDPNEVFVIIKTKTTVQEYGSCGNYCFIGIKRNGKELIFIITPDIITSIGTEKWKSFYEATSKAAGKMYNIGYVTCKDKLLVTSIEDVAS